MPFNEEPRLSSRVPFFYGEFVMKVVEIPAACGRRFALCLGIEIDDKNAKWKKVSIFLDLFNNWKRLLGPVSIPWLSIYLLNDVPTENILRLLR